jgi:hypothetical protein
MHKNLAILEFFIFIFEKFELWRLFCNYFAMLELGVGMGEELFCGRCCWPTEQK